MIELIVLRLIHVLGGIFWVGAGIFQFLYLGPALAAAGPAAGPVMQTMRRRRLFVVLPTVAVLTILSGLRLMMILSDGFDGSYFGTPMGATFAFGGACAILAFVIGWLFAMPSQKRLGVLGPQLAAAEDDASRAAIQAQVAALQRRLRVIGPLITVLLIAAAIAMAVARYM